MNINTISKTKYPLIQGGMANIATAPFAASVSNAGALGLIGAGGMNAATLREQIRLAKTLTDQPFGVNLMLMNPEVDQMAHILIEEGVQVITTGAGNPGQYMAAWNEDHRDPFICVSNWNDVYAHILSIQPSNSQNAFSES